MTIKIDPRAKELRALLRAILPLAKSGTSPQTPLKVRLLINDARVAIGQKAYAIPGVARAPKVLRALQKHGPITAARLAHRMGWSGNESTWALWYLEQTGQARANREKLGRLLVEGAWEAVPVKAGSRTST